MKHTSNITPSQQYQFFTIYEQDNLKLPNIFSEQVREPENFVTSARKYDIVGYKFVKNYTIKKQKNHKKRERNQSIVSFTTNSSRRPTKKIDCIPKDSLIQEISSIEERSKKLDTTKFQRAKIFYQNIQSIWSAEQFSIRKRIGKKQTMNANITNYRAKFEERCLNTLQERKMNISPELWKETLCREVKLENLYDSQIVERIIKSPKQLVVVGNDKLKREKEWIKNHPFNMFTKHKNNFQVKDQAV